MPTTKSTTGIGKNRSYNNRNRQVRVSTPPSPSINPAFNQFPTVPTIPLPDINKIADDIGKFSTRFANNFSKNIVDNALQTQLGVQAGSPVQIIDVGSKATISTASADERARTELRRDRINRTTPSKPKPLPMVNPATYDWNLPPHKWSLPTQPAVVNAKHNETQRLTRKVLPDRYRRGRIWWRANAPIGVVDASKTSTNLTEGDFNRKFGFQFLWNPEAFGTQVQVQLEATPSVEDRFLGVAGFFPATQTISFTLRIDRTNDFACAQGQLAKNPGNGAYDSQLVNTVRLGQDSRFRTRLASDVFTAADVEDFKKFYKPGDAFEKYGAFNGAFDSSGGDAMSRKLIDLFQRGTIADIEYLYKTINGPGPGGAGSQVEWVNGRGIKTADIGYLMPTLVHVDIGPLSYDGYVTNLQVNHTSFTPSMVPIRSDITVSLNVLATSALTGGPAAG